MSVCAVLVIDVQLAPFNTPPPVYRGEQVLAAINRLIAWARGRALPVIFVQHDGPVGSPMEPHSANWQLHPGLRREAGDAIVRKTACDAFHQSELQAVLQQHDVGQLLVCGFASEFCVDTTVRRAAVEGYQTVLVTDAHSTKDRPALDAERIVAHHNWLLPRIVLPGNPISGKSVEQITLHGV